MALFLAMKRAKGYTGSLPQYKGQGHVGPTRRRYVDCIVVVFDVQYRSDFRSVEMVEVDTILGFGLSSAILLLILWLISAFLLLILWLTSAFLTFLTWAFLGLMLWLISAILLLMLGLMLLLISAILLLILWLISAFLTFRSPFRTFLFQNFKNNFSPSLCFVNKMQHTIIGLSGSKRCGKDSVAAILKKNHQYKQASYAMFLKEACQKIFMFSYEQLYGDEKEVQDTRWHTTPRKVLQIVGTDLFRDRFKELLPECVPANSSIWCECMKKYLDSFHSPQLIVISDVRFEDEAELIRSRGGKIWRITRPGLSTDDTHSSETEGLRIRPDHVLDNSDTLSSLERKVDELMPSRAAPSPWTKRQKRPLLGLQLDIFPTSLLDLERAKEVTFVPPKRQKTESKTAIESGLELFSVVAEPSHDEPQIA